jgi:tetratricopeptide (TPR) repeat protein
VPSVPHRRALFGLVAAFALLVAAAGWPSRAGAAEPAAAARQTELIRQAERAEREERVDNAIQLYRQAIEAAPHARLARRARTRLEWLGERSRGGAGPLAALMRMQQLAPGQLTVERLRAFETQVDGFPPGQVRRESRELIADSWFHRLHRPLDAVHAYQKWLAEPGLGRADWQAATMGLALARAKLGDVHASIDALRRAGLGKKAETSFLEVERVARWACPLSFALIGLFVALSLGLGGWRGLCPSRLKQALSPGRLGIGAFAYSLPVILARMHRPQTWRAMLLLAPASAGLLLLASVAGIGLDATRERPRLRRVIIALGVLSQLAVGFLAFYYSRTLLGMLVSMRALSR